MHIYVYTYMRLTYVCAQIYASAATYICAQIYAYMYIHICIYICAQIYVSATISFNNTPCTWLLSVASLDI